VIAVEPNLWKGLQEMAQKAPAGTGAPAPVPPPAGPARELSLATRIIHPETTTNKDPYGASVPPLCVPTSRPFRPLAPNLALSAASGPAEPQG
jgi:hypothetical protein